MTIRATTRSQTFQRDFQWAGFDALIPAETYDIEDLEDRSKDCPSSWIVASRRRPRTLRAHRSTGFDRSSKSNKVIGRAPHNKTWSEERELTEI